MSVTRRPVEAGDRDFLFKLYASVRAAEMAMVPWTPEQKRMFVEMQFEGQCRGYAETYPHAFHEIILRDGVAAGRIYWSREPARLHILDITIAPEQRNAKIGSNVLEEIVAEADRDGKRVSIYVETFNPSQTLFKRLGFGPVSVDGFLQLFERPARNGEGPNRSSEHRS